MPSSSHIVPVLVGDRPTKLASDMLLQDLWRLCAADQLSTVPKGTERCASTPTPFHDDRMFDTWLRRWTSCGRAATSSAWAAWRLKLGRLPQLRPAREA